MKTRFAKSKVLAVILCVVLFISSLPVMSVSAENLITEDGFEYVIENGEVKIFGFKSTVRDVVIPSEIDGLPVTKIEYAFQYDPSIDSVYIPGSVKTISMFAFQHCENLTSVVMENGVESIGDNAFNSCTKLTSITIPESVINISRYAFYNTAYYNDESNWNGNELYIGTALIEADATAGENYVIKPGTTVIGEGAFKGTEFTGVIDMPDSVRGISDGAFSSCGITSINLSSSLTYIGDRAFDWCRSLESITLPQSLKSIGHFAFTECDSLTSVTIPKGVTYIGNSTFNCCLSLSEINVESANKNYASVNGVLYDKGITNLIQYPSGKTDESFIIPDTVTTISTWSLVECDDIVSVKVPDSVTSIDTYFLYDCENLVSANIPSRLEIIPRGMLCYCDKLTSINIPASVTAIEEDALGYCYGIEEINVDVNNKAFASVDGVLFDKNVTTLITYPAGKTDAEYTVPDTVTAISKRAFEKCEHITKVTIPNSVKTIGHNAFNGCRNLLYATLPDGLTTIESHTFAHCSSLITISIPDTVTNICAGAFFYCSNLRYINIPKGVANIGSQAFGYCENLWHVLYKGSSLEQWSSIAIYEGNSYLTEATRHYGATDKMIGYYVTKAPDCTNYGSAYYGCHICGEKSEIGISATGHTEENGVCIVCNTTVYQSMHPYLNKMEQIWAIYKEDAKTLTISFSSDTETEKNCDFIYIYDKYDNEIGKYSGTELADKSITVEGDTCKIRLVSDDSSNYYGFRVVNIEADYSDTELGDVDGDGEISVSDVTEIQLAISKQITLSDGQLKAADTDKDGSITVNDVTTLQFYLAKIITEL